MSHELTEIRRYAVGIRAMRDLVRAILNSGEPYRRPAEPPYGGMVSANIGSSKYAIQVSWKERERGTELTVLAWSQPAERAHDTRGIAESQAILDRFFAVVEAAFAEPPPPPRDIA